MILSIASDRSLLNYLRNGVKLVREGGCTSTMQLFRIASATQNPICKIYLNIYFHIPKIIFEMKITDFPCEIFRERCLLG